MKNNSNKKILELCLMSIIFLAMSILSFKQSVEMKITEKVNYEESGNMSYKVYLTDSKFYNANYLDEGMQYISSIIDYIDLNFNYLVNFDENIDYILNTKTLAEIKIVDKEDNSNVIYSSSEVLEDSKTDKVNDKNYINISRNLKLNYKKYNELANEFKSSYGISANCKLIVNLYLDYNGKYKSIENISNNRVMSLEIPLSEQMINIKKTENINNTSQFAAQTNKSLFNKLLLVVSIFFLIITLFVLIKLIMLIAKVKKSETNYEKALRKILRQYDSYITESSESINLDSKTLIKISSFKELLDVRNNVEKTIIYNKINEFNSRFMIIDDSQIYYYEMKAEDYK